MLDKLLEIERRCLAPVHDICGCDPNCEPLPGDSEPPMPDEDDLSRLEVK